MSDDLYFGDDIFVDDEEEVYEDAVDDEASNRLFMRAVMILGGLMAVAIVGIVGLILFNLFGGENGQQQVAAPVITETPDATMIAELTPIVGQPGDVFTETPTEMPDDVTEPMEPTETSEPTETPVIGATSTPTETPEGGVGVGDGEPGDGEVAEVTPMPTFEPRRTATPTPTRTPRPTYTPRRTTAGNGDEQTPDTGLGEMLLMGAAALFMGVLFVARRLRKV